MAVRPRNQMKQIQTILAVATATYLLALGCATAVTSQAIINPFFQNAAGVSDYTGWTLNAPWRGDGAGSRLIFEVNHTNPTGFIAAVGLGRDLATAPEIVADPGFTTADNAFLTGFVFDAPFIQTFAGRQIAGGHYNLFFEVDVSTATGTYRGKSRNAVNPWFLEAGPIRLDFAWDNRPFLGDPAAARDGGIKLSAITGIEYRAVIEVMTPATNPNTASGFFGLDNLSLTGQITLQPAAEKAR